MHVRSRVRFYLLIGSLILLAAAVLAAAGGVWPANAAGQAPANVTLSRFEVFALNNAVRVEWSTDTEINVAGFYVRRSQNGSTYVDLPGIGFVPATGGDVTGADYTVVDSTAQNGQSYFYKLIELETSGTEVELDIRQVTLNVGASPTTVIIGGGGATSTPSAVTNTPAPTATGRGQTATPSPSPTQRGTLTPTPTPTLRPTTAPTATPSPTTAPALFNLPPTAAPATPAGETEPQTAVPTPILDTADEPAPADPFFVGTPVVMPSPTAAAVTVPVGANQEGVVLAQAETASRASPVPIAGRRAATPPPDAAPAQQAEDSAAVSRGRLLLWGGFLAAGLLFLGSVVGSIVLFTRKHSGSEPQPPTSR